MPGDPFDIGEEPFSFEGPFDSTASTYNLSEEKIKELAKESESGNSEAAFRLYQFFSFVQQDPIQSIQWLSRAAELGNDIAIRNLETVKNLYGMGSIE